MQTKGEIKVFRMPLGVIILLSAATVFAGATATVVTEKNEITMSQQRELIRVMQELAKTDKMILQQMHIQTEVLKDLQFIAHIDVG